MSDEFPSNNPESQPGAQPEAQPDLQVQQPVAQPDAQAGYATPDSSFGGYTTPQPAAGPAPGWYPDSSGQQRYWDGATWTDNVAGSLVPTGQPQALTDDDRLWGTLSHALSIFVGFLAPLIILLVKGDQSVYVKHHAIESLNFAITVTIAASISAILIIVLIGILLLPIVLIAAFVLQIMAAIAANRGEWYRYPMTLRLISGPIPA